MPDEAFERGLKYMASCRDKKGAYGYTGPAGPRVTLTAIGSLTLSLARLKNGPVLQGFPGLPEKAPELPGFHLSVLF
ncbi:hypothetical protein [Akkermansia muciniphila]|uniref:hypothetical protein n=1 Tax=Akkermansia muciniphila TaxID=239935 RepID=UPI00068F2EEF|nr:hypothetical protein [Akkermansia muciniphila]